MSIPPVKFNNTDRPEFFDELRKRVNQHFKDNKISKYANANMKIKTIFMICLYFLPLAAMLSGLVSSLGWVLLMWLLMGFGMSGIGLSIMHDANHGAYSRNKNVNKYLGYLVNFIGGYHVNWKIQHNVLHHSFTNVHDIDEDIKKPIMRFSPNQTRKNIYRFQAFYAPFFYSLMTAYWLVSKDFEQVVRYNKANLLSGQNTTFKKSLTEIILTKALYVILFIALPLILIPIPWWQILLGFLMMQFISGLLLALIFQPAHVVENTNFFKVAEDGSVENNWAIHQMRTTSNFANRSVVFSWLIGGLNYQIEHHLFPNICHIHYKKISKIVKKTAEEFNIPYYHHKTFFGAVRSHFMLLNSLGTGSYDRAMANS